MNTTNLLSFLFVGSWLCLIAPTSVAQDGAPEPTPNPPEAPGVAVVELFTSQGCSSCPPADAVLKQIAAYAEKRDRPIYALSFHVDYWNRLGWTDPFSSPAFSQRQRLYAIAQQSRRVYTPQMVVNGRTEFNGSNKSKSVSAISAALRTASVSKIDIHISEISDDGSISVTYAVSGNVDNSVLNLAVIETPEPTNVASGENTGRTLEHANVVRAFKTVSLDHSSNRVEIQPPSDLQVADVTIIGYVQDKSTLSISGAAVAKRS